MHTIAEVAAFLERFAPSVLAEEWDNVGLLVGRADATVERVMTCLTITPESGREAIARRAELIVSHHPLPFRPLRRLTGETAEGRMLLDLVAARVAVYSPHTAFDSAQAGINQRLAEGLQLSDIRPLVAAAELGSGAGRYGRLTASITLAQLVQRVKSLLKIEHAQAVGTLNRPVRQVAIACGSAGEFLPRAVAAGCDAFVTGETRFHTALEAESSEVGLVLAGHYASERFGIEALAGVLAKEFPALQVWPSADEHDPLHWL